MPPDIQCCMCEVLHITEWLLVVYRGLGGGLSSPSAFTLEIRIWMPAVARYCKGQHEKKQKTKNTLNILPSNCKSRIYICLLQHAEKEWLRLHIIITALRPRGEKTNAERFYGLGSSGSESGLWSPVALRVQSEGGEDEVDVEIRINVDCWSRVISCCCCGSACLCKSNVERLSSTGTFKVAKLGIESLDSRKALFTLWLGPWVGGCGA